MNLKNSKGISIISLVVTVVIIGILATVAVSIGTDIAEKAEFENVETYLLLIQSKSKMMAESKAMGEIEEGDLLGIKQTEGTYSGWYLLSQEDLNNMGINGANAEDGYYVDYDNDDVAYSKGISLEEKTYYKLSEILISEE